MQSVPLLYKLKLVWQLVMHAWRGDHLSYKMLFSTSTIIYATYEYRTPAHFILFVLHQQELKQATHSQTLDGENHMVKAEKKGTDSRLTDLHPENISIAKIDSNTIMIVDW